MREAASSERGKVRERGGIEQVMVGGWMCYVMFCVVYKLKLLLFPRDIFNTSQSMIFPFHLHSARPPPVARNFPFHLHHFARVAGWYGDHINSIPSECHQLLQKYGDTTISMALQPNDRPTGQPYNIATVLQGSVDKYLPGGVVDHEWQEVQQKRREKGLHSILLQFLSQQTAHHHR